jgi:hypothetical protein
MTIAEMFEQLLNNLSINNKQQISDRYAEITCALNKAYRNTDSKTANSLQVGSYGRGTAIRGVSDLDMLYFMPASIWDKYKDGRQSSLLQDVKNAIKGRYSRTEIWGDGQVVVVSFGSQEIEVVPAFELTDGSFKYPNTNNGGSWPITKPRSEISAILEMDKLKNYNLRPLCKIARAWKNKHGVVMSGFLIDTLAYNFLKSTTDYDTKSYLYFDYMVRDFFRYLSELPDQDYFLAPGSNQRVIVKKKFQRKAKKGYELCLKAIEADGKVGVNAKWKKVFGRPFPAATSTAPQAALGEAIRTWDNTEEFIEDKYSIDIRYNLEIDCEVLQNGFREHLLSYMLSKHIPLLARKKLLFQVTKINVPPPYHIEWKVLNRGPMAERKNQIRGQIIKDDGSFKKEEHTLFQGEHVVECYAIRNGVVVAKDRIDVPITTGS